MEYFLLTQDRRISHSMEIPHLFDIIHPKKAIYGDFGGLDTVTTFKFQSTPYTHYPDVLDRSIYLVSKELRDVFSLFLSDSTYKIFCGIDSKNQNYYYYYAYTFPYLDVLSDKSILNKDRTKIMEVVLKNEVKNGPDILKIAGVNTHAVLVSLPIAEYILAHSFKGIRLIKTTFE